MPGSFLNMRGKHKEKEQVQMLIRHGRIAEAADLSHALSMKLPDDPGVWMLRAAVAASRQDFHEIVTCCERALANDPGHVPALYNLAVAKQSLGNLCDAESLYHQVLKIEPEHVSARFNLSLILRQLNKLDEAEQHALLAARYAPRIPNVHVNLGLIFKDRQQFNEAAQCFLTAMDIEPGFANAHYCLGLVYQEMLLPKLAEQSIRNSLRLQPGNPEAHNDLGIALHTQGKADQAIEHYRKAIELCPDHVRAHRNLSATLLFRGRFSEGWEEYEWRLRSDPPPPFPLTSGLLYKRLTRDKSVYVVPEQGIGDEIMFSSCVPDLLDVVGKVFMQCDPRLISIYERSFTAVTLAAVGTQAVSVTPASTDLCIASGSLPLLFRKTGHQFPKNSRYLHPDPAKSEKCKERLSCLGDGLKIGISWRGGMDRQTRQLRSIPLAEWKPILKMPGAQFVNLQYGDHGDEISAIQAAFGVPIHSWDDIDPLVKLDEYFALIGELDLVISIDNATVHMAGALGTPTWCLLSSTPEWRWLSQGEKSLWYESLRLFRQSAPADWNAVFQAVKFELDRLVHQSRS